MGSSAYAVNALRDFPSEQASGTPTSVIVPERSAGSSSRIDPLLEFPSEGSTALWSLEPLSEGMTVEGLLARWNATTPKRIGLLRRAVRVAGRTVRTLALFLSGVLVGGLTVMTLDDHPLPVPAMRSGILPPAIAPVGMGIAMPLFSTTDDDASMVSGSGQPSNARAAAPRRNLRSTRQPAPSSTRQPASSRR